MEMDAIEKVLRAATEEFGCCPTWAIPLTEAWEELAELRKKAALQLAKVEK
jgi:hypothetical protein